MSVKTYKVKIDFGALPAKHTDYCANPKPSGGAPCRVCARAWLWATHVAFNTGVKYLRQKLSMLRRGAGLFRRDGQLVPVMTEEELSKATIKNDALFQALKSKGISGPKALELAHYARDVFRYLCPKEDLDEELVSQAGMSQEARQLYGPLTDKSSAGFSVREFEELLETLKPLAKLGHDLERTHDPTEAAKRAYKILEKIDPDETKYGTGSPPAHTRLIEAWKKNAADSELVARCEKQPGKRREALKGIKAAEYRTAALCALETWDYYRERFGGGKDEEFPERVSSDEGRVRTAVSKLREALGGRVFAPAREVIGLEGEKGSEEGSEWERSMWSIAMQRVLAHIGWWSRRQKEKTAVELKRKHFIEGGYLKDSEYRPLSDPPADVEDWQHSPGYGSQKWFKALRAYEDARTKSDPEAAGTGIKDRVRITGRMLKGWDRVRERWLSAKQQDAQTLMKIVNDLRAVDPRSYGDHRLFEWLAAPECQWLWNGSVSEEESGRADGDCLRAMEAHNRLIDETPSHVQFTEPDPIDHPVWMYYGENSAVKYRIEYDLDRQRPTAIILEVLRLHAGKFARLKNVRLPIAPYPDLEKSFRLVCPDCADGNVKRCRLSCRYCRVDGSWCERVGVKTGKKLPNACVQVSAKEGLIYSDDLMDGEWLGGASYGGVKLIWDRDALDRFSVSADRPGSLSALASKTPQNARVFLSFSCEVPAKTPVPFLLKPTWRASEVAWCNDQKELVLKKEVTHSKDGWLPPDKRRWPTSAIDGGFRILSIDLGMRHAATYTVWELTRQKGVWCVGTDPDGKPVFARKVRDGFVDLPGDDEELAKEEAELRRQLRTLRTRVNGQATLLRVVRLLTVEKKTIDGKDVPLTEAELQVNAESAAEVLHRWAQSESIGEPLRNALEKVVAKPLFAPDQLEAFSKAVSAHRKDVAKMLWDGQPGRIADSGLWAELNRGLETDVREFLKKLRGKPPVEKRKELNLDCGLPSGQTLRGGLSIARLNFLRDAYDFVKKWTFRPRWPGDRRSPTEDQSFAKRERDHLEALREDRTKKTAFGIVAAALGYKADLKRGLWRHPSGLWQHPESGRFFEERGATYVEAKKSDTLADARPHPVEAPCHAIIFEDLSRYRFRQDRPRLENAGLMQWSHRHLIDTTKQIAAMYGLPVGTAYAAFSSQFCSECGAPGARVSRFETEWLEQEWVKRTLASKGKGNEDIRRVANIVKRAAAEGKLQSDADRPWVQLGWGTHFVCANAACERHAQPVNADLNASANIGLRWLRGSEDFRAVVHPKNDRLVRKLRFIPASGFRPHDGGYVPCQVKGGSKSVPIDDDHDAGSGYKVLFRDPTGKVAGLGKGILWYEAKKFWGIARKLAVKKIRAAWASFEEGGEADDEDETS